MHIDRIEGICGISPDSGSVRSANDIVELKRAAISDAVIGAMLESQHQAPSPHNPPVAAATTSVRVPEPVANPSGLVDVQFTSNPFWRTCLVQWHVSLQYSVRSEAGSPVNANYDDAGWVRGVDPRDNSRSRKTILGGNAACTVSPLVRFQCADIQRYSRTRRPLLDLR
jgi:hypothetical protein